MAEENVFRSGYVSIVGRPNTGKSTLLNVLAGQKLAIVSKRPQTTRNRILGIRNLPGAQIIFIDTPGLHEPRNLLGRTMVRTVKDVLREIDAVLLVVESSGITARDRAVAESLQGVGKPVILIVNKVDLVRKPDLLKVMDDGRAMFGFADIIPVSAMKRDGIDRILDVLSTLLPEGPKYYPDDIVTDQLERFMAAEIIREKIMRKTSDELPYSVAVEVLRWRERPDGLVAIDANIYVEREGQKAIIIGKRGIMLKSIGTAARADMEKLLNAKVFLELWVKVRKNWRNDDQLLKELGYR